MNTGLLIGYFLAQQEAIRAFQKLKNKGFRRVAWISKDAGGEIRIGKPFLQRWFFGVKKELIKNHERWLIAGDTALILMAPIETLKIPANILLESEEEIGRASCRERV